MTLLSITQQQAIKPISPNWAVGFKVAGGINNYSQLAKEVEENEVSELIGISLLQDLQDNPTLASNVKLLDGDSFTNCENRVIKTRGLRYVIAYLNYSKYITESYISDTFTGFVKKNRNESEGLSLGDLKKIQLDVRDIAMREWSVIREYLNVNYANFPLWFFEAKKNIYKPILTGIKKTYN